MKLKKLIVRRQGGLRVKKLLLTDLRDKKDITIGVEKLVASLGPSASFRVDTLELEELDRVSSSSTTQRLATKFRYYLNRLKCLHPLFRGNQVLKESMWASGSTSVILIGIKLPNQRDNSNSILEDKMELFRKFLDGVNQHFTPISERLIYLPNNSTYRFFALQMTGGGNFPSRFTKPDVVVNLLHTTEHLFGLNEYNNDDNNPVDSIFEDGDIMYDIIQVRGCGRSVSATNSITFAPLANNAVINYALGGIGMTTMFPNAELSLQLLESMEKVKKGTVKNFVSSTVGEVENPLQDIDYSMMIDDPNLTVRMLGVNTTVSTKERLWLTAIALTTTVILLRLL
jgi:hypothetical protein